MNIENYETLNQTKAHQLTSSRYAFVPTSRMLSVLADYGWRPLKINEARVRAEDRKGFQTHIVRLRNDIQAPTVVGEYAPELVLKNSHLGSSAFCLMWGIYRLVCANGLVIGENWGEEKVRHIGFAEAKAEEAVKQIGEKLPSIINEVESFRNTKLLPSQRDAFAKATIDLIRDPESKWTMNTADVLRPKRWVDQRDDSLWSTLNVVQENVIRGGIRQRNSMGRRLSTRAVTSVDRNIRLNRALWTLAQELQKQIVVN